MRSSIICVAYDKKSNEKIEDFQVDVTQIIYDLLINIKRRMKINLIRRFNLIINI